MGLQSHFLTKSGCFQIERTSRVEVLVLKVVTSGIGIAWSLWETLSPCSHLDLEPIGNGDRRAQVIVMHIDVREALMVIPEHI